MLRFTNHRPVDASTPLAPHHAAQVLAFGSVLDGEALTPAERFAQGWYEPAICDVVDEAGLVRYEVWTSNVDCGAVFVGGTTTLVAPIIQFGFATNDLAAWLALATATPLPERVGAATVSWAISEDGGPMLCPYTDELTKWPRSSLRIGVAWPVLVEALRPWEATRALVGLVTARTGARSATLRGAYGNAAVHDALAVRTYAVLFEAVPRDAIARLPQPLAILERLGIAPGDGIDISWIEAQLAALRELVRTTAAANQGLAVAVA